MRLKNLSCLSVLLAVLCAAAAAQHTVSDPRQWLRSGPMLGYSEMTETVVWLQTTRPARAQVRYWKPGQPASARLSAPVETSAAGDHIARITLSDLDFGTRYEYELYLDGLRVELPGRPTFQTQSMWHWRTDPPPFKMAIASCFYVNDPPYDRPGEPYGGSPAILNAILAEKPDFMLWLGDNVYYREADWLNESGMRYRYAHTRALPELQPLLASMHHYATWDDHDYGPNDSDRSYRLREPALQIFKDYWANASYGHDGVPGVFGRFEWSDVEFFLLDGRYHRSPNRMPDGAGKVMFGEAQMRWLKEALRSSRAPFKIIVSGSQVLNRPAGTYRFEYWGEFPQEKQEFLDFLREARIPGVIFLSGDRHHTELLRLEEPGLYPLYEFTSSPLTAGVGRADSEKDNPLRVPGTWVQERNFGVLEVSGPRTDRVLVLRTVDQHGKELWRRQIRASELRLPQP